MARRGARGAAAARGPMIVNAVVGIVLGLVILLWPGIGLLAVAILFGIALIVAGLFRVTFAVTGPAPAGFRWLAGMLGLLMVVTGVLALAHPVFTLVFIAVMIGVSWIFDGAYGLMTGASGRTAGPRWLPITGGIISVLAGIVVLASPALAVGAFAVLAGILLIVVSILTLVTLPARAPRR
jgi:uncharacterized membrane protein HdeD (DUF308 family)